MISLENIFLIFTILSIGLISILVSPYYVFGDQLHYRDIYSNLDDLNISDAFKYYIGRIDSKEPGYFLISWSAASLGVQKDIFMMLSNMLLAALAFKLLMRVGSHYTIAFILVVFSYYSDVLFFSAERLKFGIIFLLIFLLSENKKYKYIFFALMCHAQVLILVFSFLLLFFKNIFKNILSTGMIKKANLYILLVFIILSIIGFLILKTHLLSKFSSYYSDRGIVEIIRTMVFFILTLIYSKNKSDVFYVFIPIFIAVILFGGERVNFLSYFIFLYYSLHYRKGFNLGILLTTSYFVYTGLFFIKNILLFGDGFSS